MKILLVFFVFPAFAQNEYCLSLLQNPDGYYHIQDNFMTQVGADEAKEKFGKLSPATLRRIESYVDIFGKNPHLLSSIKRGLSTFPSLSKSNSRFAIHMLSLKSQWPMSSAIVVGDLALLYYLYSLPPNNDFFILLSTYPVAFVNITYAGMSVGNYRMNSKSINRLWPIFEFVNDHQHEFEAFDIQIPRLPFAENLWRSKSPFERLRSRRIFISQVRNHNPELLQLIQEIAFLDIAAAIATPTD